MLTGRLLQTLMAAAVLCAAGGLGFGTTAAYAAQKTTLVTVQTGDSVILRTPGLQRIAVGDGRIAGVVPLGSEQLVVNGKLPGRTTLYVWQDGRRTQYEVTVTAQVVDDLARMLRSSITDPNVQVVSFNKSVVVRGVVRDGAEYQSLNDIIGRFNNVAKESQYTVVNVVTLARPLGDLQHDIAKLPGASDIRVDPDGKGNVIVSGRVHDAQAAQFILERAKALAGPYLAADGKLIDRISSDTTSLIDVKVYVLEVDNTFLQNIGLALNSANFNQGAGGAQYTIGGPSFPIVENPVGLGKALTSGPFFRTITLAPTLNLQLQQGPARMLSSPDLVTLPGNNATFLVGGSVPFPVAAGLGQVSIQFQPYGVQLNVTPTLLGNGSIETKISPDISDLDFQDGITQNGFVVPALKESKLSTDVITAPGESIIMGGMLRHIEQKTIQKIPLLGDIPILGKLFRSTYYQNNESNVVFIMTPEVITR